MAKATKERKPLTKKQRISCVVLIAVLVVSVCASFIVPHFMTFGRMYEGDYTGLYGWPKDLIVLGEGDRFCLTMDGRLLLLQYQMGGKPKEVKEVPLTRIFLTFSNFDLYFENSQKQQWLYDTNPQEIRRNTVAAWSGKYVPEGSDGKDYYQYYILQQRNGTLVVMRAIFDADSTMNEDPSRWPSLVWCGAFWEKASADEFYALCEKGYYQWER